jgi:hypothetical protein
MTKIALATGALAGLALMSPGFAAESTALNTTRETAAPPAKKPGTFIYPAAPCHGGRGVGESERPNIHAEDLERWNFAPKGRPCDGSAAPHPKEG